MDKDVIYPTMVIRSQAETIEIQEKEIERLNNIIDKALEIIEPEISYSFKGDELFLMPDQLEELLKILKEGKENDR